MRRTLWLPSLLVLLAGCTSPGPPAPSEEVVTITNATDYRQDDGQREHVHDYWAGESRVEVLQDASALRVSCESCGELQGPTFVPPEGRIVPQGTGWVNVTLSWQGGSADEHGPVRLYAKSAVDAEAQLVGETDHAKTFTVNVTNEMADPPHYVLSLWRFEVRFAPGDGRGTAFDGRVELEVEAFRGRPLVPYPPHPDLWDGGRSVPLFDARFDERTIVYNDGGSTCMGGCLGVVVPEDGRVVPWDADRAVVTLVYDTLSTSQPIGLSYHGANTWTEARVDSEEEPPSTVRWTIPLERVQNDSPYAKQSLWEFRLSFEGDLDPRAWRGAFTVSGVAERDL